MAATILALGSYLIYPIVILVLTSFNTARDVMVGPTQWGLSNWSNAWDRPHIFESLFNSVMIWFLVAVIAVPVSIAISLVLARTNIPFSHGLEFLFWIAFIFPSISSTFGWMILLDPDWGFINKALEWLPFIDKGPLNIYSIPGIVWARLMADGIAFKVILLTPAFRNMDRALEESARVSGATDLRTVMKVTLPVMAPSIVLVISLQLIRMFQGFEVEYLLGARWGFYVYSTSIYQLVRGVDIPQYADAVVLASITAMIIAVIVPLQRWVIGRRSHTTVQGSFKPGLIDLGRLRWPMFSALVTLLSFLTVLPASVLVVGSFMSRVGFFNAKPRWTLDHWSHVFGSPEFLDALRTTLVLSLTAGIVSPILFSLFAYMIVRTEWRGRRLLDVLIWGSASMPGILVGLGLLLMFLRTPGLRHLFGTIWALIIVVIVAGVTTGVNVLKGVLVQVGASLEEAGRASGAGWWRTYTRIVIPVLMPTMVLVGMLSFVLAAGMTSSIILLASRETNTLSILALEWGSGALDEFEAAGIIGLITTVLTLGAALPLRYLALRMGVRHDQMQSGQ